MRASVALLDAVASDLESSAWVIVVTRRDVDGGWTLEDHDHVRIELGSLSREDTLTLALTTTEAAQLPPHVLNLAADRSGGSPSFLLDLLAAAADGHPTSFRRVWVRRRWHGSMHSIHGTGSSCGARRCSA